MDCAALAFGEMESRSAAKDEAVKAQVIGRLSVARKLIGLGYRKVSRGKQALTGLILSVLRQNLLRMRNRSGVFG